MEPKVLDLDSFREQKLNEERNIKHLLIRLQSLIKDLKPLRHKTEVKTLEARIKEVSAALNEGLEWN